MSLHEFASRFPNVLVWCVCEYLSEPEVQYMRGYRIFNNIAFASRRQMWSMFQNNYRVTKKQYFIHATMLNDLDFILQLHMKLRNIPFDTFMRYAHMDIIRYMHGKHEQWMESNVAKHITQREDVYNWKMEMFSHFDFYHRFDQAMAVCDVDYINEIWDFADLSRTCLARGIMPPQEHPRFPKFFLHLSIVFHILPKIPKNKEEATRDLHRYLYYRDWEMAKVVFAQWPTLSMPTDLIDGIDDVELLLMYKDSYVLEQRIMHPIEVTKWRLEHGMPKMKIDSKRLECVIQDPRRIVEWCKLLHWNINQQWIQVWLQLERSYEALVALEEVLEYAKRENIKLKIPRITDGGPHLQALTT